MKSTTHSQDATPTAEALNSMSQESTPTLTNFMTESHSNVPSISIASMTVSASPQSHTVDASLTVTIKPTISGQIFSTLSIQDTATASASVSSTSSATSSVSVTRSALATKTASATSKSSQSSSSSARARATTTTVSTKTMTGSRSKWRSPTSTLTVGSLPSDSPSPTASIGSIPSSSPSPAAPMSISIDIYLPGSGAAAVTSSLGDILVNDVISTCANAMTGDDTTGSSLSAKNGEEEGWGSSASASVFASSSSPNELALAASSGNTNSGLTRRLLLTGQKKKSNRNVFPRQTVDVSSVCAPAVSVNITQQRAIATDNGDVYIANVTQITLTLRPPRWLLAGLGIGGTVQGSTLELAQLLTPTLTSWASTPPPAFLTGWIACTGVVDTTIAVGAVSAAVIPPRPPPPPPPPYPTILVATLTTCLLILFILCVFPIGPIIAAMLRRLSNERTAVAITLKAAVDTQKGPRRLAKEAAVAALLAEKEAERATAVAAADLNRSCLYLTVLRVFRGAWAFICAMWLRLVNTADERFPRAVTSLLRFFFRAPILHPVAAAPNLPIYADIADALNLNIVNSIYDVDEARLARDEEEVRVQQNYRRAAADDDATGSGIMLRLPEGSEEWTKSEGGNGEGGDNVDDDNRFIVTEAKETNSFDITPQKNVRKKTPVTLVSAFPSNEEAMDSIPSIWATKKKVIGSPATNTTNNNDLVNPRLIVSRRDVLSNAAMNVAAASSLTNSAISIRLSQPISSSRSLSPRRIASPPPIHIDQQTPRSAKIRPNIIAQQTPQTQRRGVVTMKFAVPGAVSSSRTTNPSTPLSPR